MKPRRGGDPRSRHPWRVEVAPVKTQARHHVLGAGAPQDDQASSPRSPSRSGFTMLPSGMTSSTSSSPRHRIASRTGLRRALRSPVQSERLITTRCVSPGRDLFLDVGPDVARGRLRAGSVVVEDLAFDQVVGVLVARRGRVLLDLVAGLGERVRRLVLLRQRADVLRILVVGVDRRPAPARRGQRIGHAARSSAAQDAPAHGDPGARREDPRACGTAR